MSTNARDTGAPHQPTASREVNAPAPPKSFAPQPRGGGQPNAWESLHRLSHGGETTRPDADALLAVARSTVRARQARTRYLPEAMFGEPAWDMMLELYIGARSEARHRITSLCAASGAPATTALRWIDYLEKAGLAQRSTSPTDKRVMFIELTDKGRIAVEKYLLDVARATTSVPRR